MKLRGVIRSTESVSDEGVGQTASGARPVAIAAMPGGYELTDVMTVSARPGEPVTLRASAQSSVTREIEGDGASYGDALQALKALVPSEWRLQNITVVDEQ